MSPSRVPHRRGTPRSPRRTAPCARRPWPRAAAACRLTPRLRRDRAREHRAVVERIDDDRHAVVVLRAARSIAGPPMSMFSIASSNVQSGFATVASNGYRFTTRRSIGSMPCCAMTASSVPRRPSRPPWIFGCSVFTRPSMISGKPVTSRYVDRRHAGGAQQRGRAAGRQQRHAALAQCACEIDQAFLVGDAEERRGRTSHGHRSAGDPVSLQLLAQGAAIDAENVGGAALVARRHSRGPRGTTAPRPRASRGRRGVRARWPFRLVK